MKITRKSPKYDVPTLINLDFDIYFGKRTLSFVNMTTPMNFSNFEKSQSEVVNNRFTFQFEIKCNEYQIHRRLFLCSRIAIERMSQKLNKIINSNQKWSYDESITKNLVALPLTLNPGLTYSYIFLGTFFGKLFHKLIQKYNFSHVSNE